MSELVEHLRARWRRVRRRNSVPILFVEQMRRARRQRQFERINIFCEQLRQHSPIAFNMLAFGIACVVSACAMGLLILFDLIKK